MRIWTEFLKVRVEKTASMVQIWELSFEFIKYCALILELYV